MSNYPWTTQWLRQEFPGVDIVNVEMIHVSRTEATHAKLMLDGAPFCEWVFDLRTQKLDYDRLVMGLLRVFRRGKRARSAEFMALMQGREDV